MSQRKPPRFARLIQYTPYVKKDKALTVGLDKENARPKSRQGEKDRATSMACDRGATMTSHIIPPKVNEPGFIHGSTFGTWNTKHWQLPFMTMIGSLAALRNHMGVVMSSITLLNQNVPLALTIPISRATKKTPEGVFFGNQMIITQRYSTLYSHTTVRGYTRTKHVASRRLRHR